LIFYKFNKKRLNTTKITKNNVIHPLPTTRPNGQERLPSANRPAYANSIEDGSKALWARAFHTKTT